MMETVISDIAGKIKKFFKKNNIKKSEKCYYIISGLYIIDYFS